VNREFGPGADVVPTPPPLDTEPPQDRFCDLVLTGGVASGVVYPWAIVELARAYRFRNIGGTSVGAMAAALAAAAEYGRRTGFEAPFEVLRFTPAALADVLPDGRTRMLSLFQANPRGQRLIGLWGRLGRGTPEPGRSLLRKVARVLWQVLRAYRVPCAAGALVGAGLAWLLCLWHVGTWTWGVGIASAVLASILAGVGVLGALALAFVGDVRHGIAANGLGLCKGGTLEPDGPEGRRPGLSEWLHDGIQLSAGLKKTDRPLTFRDLWNAPAHPGAAPQHCGDEDPAQYPAINLQVITTNVTHGRPYRLPLQDATSRLFFRREELEGYFPPAVLDALEAASPPYAPRVSADPPASAATAGLRELRGADMPIVVAARLSLSFPLLFSAVPLWAIDYEPPRGERTLGRCQFTDGGASSNFPIHLFDSGLPRWPTFGLWLDRRGKYRRDDAVWLPRFHGEGWGDSWNRFEDGAPGPRIGRLAGFLGAIATSAVDWRDRTSIRLPHVRNRIARLLLRPGEGGLNIGMPREQILRMAHTYGTEAGRLFVQRFADEEGRPSRAWSEQRWVRMELLVNGLRERLAGLSASAAWAAHTVPMQEAIAQAVRKGPIQDHENCNRLTGEQSRSLARLLGELERLELLLGEAERQPFKPVPEPELRLRAPL
jgi:predicted acylesterase/phospholipase RssA